MHFYFNELLIILPFTYHTYIHFIVMRCLVLRIRFRDWSSFPVEVQLASE